MFPKLCQRFEVMIICALEKRVCMRDFGGKTISSAAHGMRKLFSTSKFSYLLLCNPAPKTATGAANRWGDY